jgi:hypothetical protein
MVGHLVTGGGCLETPKHGIYDPLSSFKMYARRGRHRMVALDHSWSP